MKYEYYPGPSDAESRRMLNEKVLYLIESGTAAQAGITCEDIYNAYSGDGGLHGLARKDFDDYHSYSKAKKEIENGQFFTPPNLCQLVAKVLNPSQFDLVADLTCGKGSFFNFFPTESNLYGCEIDAKACKVAQYLFPSANITPGDIRTYKPELRFDYVMGNPPFHLKWWTEDGREILSQLYYCCKASELLKPLGILALIVPQSFLADDFSDKSMIREMERHFSFLGQVGLPDNAFAYLGVETFPTKLQLWQKKSEAKGWTAHRYTPQMAKTLPYSFDPAEEAQHIYEQMLLLPKADMEKNKSHVLLELAKEHNASKDFAYQTQKMLYQIKAHPATREQYAKCCEYLHRFYTQQMPDKMDYKEWQRVMLTEAKVLAYLHRALRRQNRKPERDVIALIKQNDNFVYKAYSSKANSQLSGDMKVPVPIYQAVLDNEPERFPGFEHLLRRKRREYENQLQSFDDMTEDPNIATWLQTFTLWDEENEEQIYLNDIQRRDINLILQKRYGMLQWEQGSGKTLAAIAVGQYRMQNQGVHSTWVVSSAISIRNNWDVALPNSALFEYDLMGNLVKTSLHRVDTQDNVDEWEITLYEYDGRGLVKKEVNALGNITTYTYDGNGNLKTKTDADGYVTTYGYNKIDLVTSINYNEGKQVSYQYNKVGDLVEMTDWTGTTSFEVDLLNRITKATDTKGNVVGYTYDEVGNRISIAYPDNTAVTYTYDLLGQMKTVTETDGRTTTYIYDGMGRTVKMEYPHGWVEDYHYDSIGQLLKVEDTDPTGKDMKQQKHIYEYDDCGNMTYEYMRGNGTGEATVENFYTYDALHRVTNAKENYGNASRTYQYDSLGNLTWETNSNNVTTDYKLNNLNQVTEKSSDGWKTHTTFTYDKRGNLIQEQYGKNKKVTNIGTYTYDETNKMVKGVNANAESSSYLYNGLGALVEQTWVIAKNSYGYHDVTAEAAAPIVEEPEAASDSADSPEVPTASDGTEAEPEAALDEALTESSDPGIMLLSSSKKDNSGKKPSDKPTGNDVKKTSIVVKQFVVDYTTETFEPLMEHEVNGLDYRYVYGNDRLSVNITGVENGSSKLIENGNQIRLYYHMDYLGTADYLTSPLTGKVESWTHYNEWGEITHNAVLKCGQRELDLVKRYATHDFDAVLNLYYAKARFYDSENRRFAAVDPILDAAQYDIKGYVSNPMQLVQYLYVSNNPVVYIDPLGLMNYFTQTGKLLSGVWQGIKDNTVGLIESLPQAIPMLKELVKGVVGGDISIVDLGKALLQGALGDYWHVARYASTLNPFKKNTDDEVYCYGHAVGSVATDIVLTLVGGAIIDKAFDLLKGTKVGQKIISLANQAKGYFDDFVCPNRQALANTLYDIKQIEATDFKYALRMPYADYAKMATNIPSSRLVVLGKFTQDSTSYARVAQRLNATFFQLDDWDTVSRIVGSTNMWQINKAFLEQQVSQGKTIILSHNPYQATGYFAQEVQFLIERGYHFETYGSYWRAVK